MWPWFAVSPTARRNYVKCVAGESLYISLEGIEVADADLSFSGEYGNVTLVRGGVISGADMNVEGINDVLNIFASIVSTDT